MESSLEGLIFVITGSTDGIGLHTARRIVACGGEVVLHGRNPDKLEKVRQEMLQQQGATEERLHAVIGDFKSLKSVENMASEIQRLVPRIDCLINNAGVFLPSYQTSQDGHELTFAVNVLAPYLLTERLKDLLLKSECPRLINTSSVSQASRPPAAYEMTKDNYNAYKAYEQSKLFNRMINFGQAKDLPSVLCLSLDPGTVDTTMLRTGWDGCAGIPLTEANDTFWIATTKELDLKCSGNYYALRRSSGGRHPFNLDQVRSLTTYLDQSIQRALSTPTEEDP